MAKILPILLLLAVALGFLIFKYPSLIKRGGINTSPAPLSNVLYPQNPDPTGRNILFYSKEGKQVLFSGMGVSYYPTGSTYQAASNSAKINIPPQVPDFVAGLFDSWQNIPNSKDKYLILTVPSSTADGKRVDTPKIRVGFSTIQEVLKSKDNFGTGVWVQDLGKIIPNAQDEDVTSYLRMGLISDFSTDDLNKLIKAGDALGVKVKFDPNKKAVLVDKDGNWVASGLILRRFKPVEQINKELNRSLLKP